MFDYKKKLKAIKLYYQFNESLARTVNALGYPNLRTLRRWVYEFESNKGKVHKKYIYNGKPRYSKSQILKAVKYYQSHGKCIQTTIKKLGYPSDYTLQKWLEKYDKDYHKRVFNSTSSNITIDKKKEAVKKLCLMPNSADEIATEYNVSRALLYQWKLNIVGKGNQHSMAKKKLKETNNTQKQDTEKELLDEISKLKAEAINLHKEVDELRLERDVLEKAAELIKKDNGISIDELTNKEKVIIIDALRDKYKLTKLLKLLKIAKSSYCYNHIVLAKEDKYKDARSTIIDIFNDNKGTYGYRRVHAELIKKSIILSEKVVRRIMKEENLVVYIPKMKKYSSYQGEITPAVKNLLKRDFYADNPYEKLLTDITEFHIPAGKVYLSPIIDCFDGLPLNWTIGTSPDAELVNTMLDKTIELTPEGKHPIIHSDRGCHYRWPGWIDRMGKAGFIRSMSKKGCSPDNSACEGFFGRLKNEFFYNKSWLGVSIEEFIKQLDDYIKWYANSRIKESLGYLSPIEYRKSLGII